MTDVDLEAQAAQLYEGKAEMEELPGDVHVAQLEKVKASKVQSAEKVLERATADPKVQKTLKKKHQRERLRVAVAVVEFLQKAMNHPQMLMRPKI